MEFLESERYIAPTRPGEFEMTNYRIVTGDPQGSFQTCWIADVRMVQVEAAEVDGTSRGSKLWGFLLVCVGVGMLLGTNKPPVVLTLAAVGVIIFGVILFVMALGRSVRRMLSFHTSGGVLRVDIGAEGSEQQTQSIIKAFYDARRDLSGFRRVASSQHTPAPVVSIPIAQMPVLTVARPPMDYDG